MVPYTLTHTTNVKVVDYKLFCNMQFKDVQVQDQAFFIIQCTQYNENEKKKR